MDTVESDSDRTLPYALPYRRCTGLSRDPCTASKRPTFEPYPGRRLHSATAAFPRRACPGGRSYRTFRIHRACVINALLRLRPPPDDVSRRARPVSLLSCRLLTLPGPQREHVLLSAASARFFCQFCHRFALFPMPAKPALFHEHRKSESAGETMPGSARRVGLHHPNRPGGTSYDR